MDFQEYAHITQVAEAAKFDTIFFQDTVGVAGSRALARGERTRAKLSRTVKLEPTATLAALAMVTNRIGLVATATTTYNEPYNIARRFASIDHISGGRAGWNLVTSQIEDESENFGFDEHLAHAERYERAAEFYEVVTGLWDSWEDDASAARQAERPSTSTATRSICSITWASTSRSRAAQHRRARRRAGRWWRRRARPKPGASSPRARPTWCSPRRRRSTRRRLLRRHQGPRGALRPRRPTTSRSCRASRRCSAAPMEEARENYEYLQSLMPDDVALQSLSHISGGLDLTQVPARRAAARAAAQQCRQGPPGAGGEHRARGQHDPAPDRPPYRRRHRPSRAGRHAAIHGRRDGSVAEGRGGRRLQRRVQPTIPSRSRISAAWSCPSCSGAASSAPSTKARPCARIWAYAFRKTDTPARRRPALAKEAS